MSDNNHSWHGLTWDTAVRVLVFALPAIIFAAGAFFSVRTDLQNIARVMENNRVAVERSLAALSSTVETARVERIDDIKDLERRVAGAEAERARLGQQVNSLEKLMEDIRDIMRKESR